jgi:hypothetical protein
MAEACWRLFFILILTVYVFRADSAGEYLSGALRRFLSTQGTLAQFSCPGTHAQNGIAERKHRHLETARALMRASSVPPHFWAKAVSTANYLINIQPSSALQGGIPFERLCGKTPNHSSLHLFGCVCYMLLSPRERTKLMAQSAECVFLGHSAKHKGYRCWDPIARRMRTSRDVVFYETRPFYPRPSSSVSSVSLVDPVFILFFPDTPTSTISASHPSQSCSMSSLGSSSLLPDYSLKPPVTQVYTRRTTIPSDAPSSSNKPAPAASSSLDVSASPCESSTPVDLSSSVESFFPAASTAEPSLRRSHRLRQPTDRYSPSAFVNIAFPEPTSYRDAILHQDWLRRSLL